MNETHYKQLYAAGSAVEELYLLESGSVLFFINSADKYMIKGNSLVVGASELLLKSFADMETVRQETLVADGGASLKKISGEKFLTSMQNSSFVLNMCMVLAKQVNLTNAIINKNYKLLQGNDKKYKDYCIQYYQLLSMIRKENDKRKMPWLKDLINKYENSLTYKKGESFAKAVEPTLIESASLLSDNMVEYQKNSIICEIGTPGDEMYVLQSGCIDVYVQDQKVASLQDKGAIIGEIALLLGDKRGATLKAKNNVVVTKIKKSELKEIAEINQDFFKEIAVSLAKKHYYNCNTINAVTKLAIEKDIERETRLKSDADNCFKAEMELNSLKKDFIELYRVKSADYLKHIIDYFDLDA